MILYYKSLFLRNIIMLLFIRININTYKIKHNTYKIKHYVSNIAYYYYY